VTAEPGSTPAGSGPADEPLRVTTLELFFDLVFAFTLTQLAALVLMLLLEQYWPRAGVASRGVAAG
jgi:low temperature requirement protein LtrA